MNHTLLLKHHYQINMDEKDLYGDLYEDGIDEQPKEKPNGGTTIED